MEEIIIETREWSAPEYTHEEKSVDWFWTIGLVTIFVAIGAVWYKNYIFSIFILISGGLLILFRIRHPRDIRFEINSLGVVVGADLYEFKNLKGFNTKKGVPYSKLLIQTNKYFLPMYTIPVPDELIPEIRESLQKAIPLLPLEESKSMQFADKLGL